MSQYSPIPSSMSSRVKFEAARSPILFLHVNFITCSSLKHVTSNWAWRLVVILLPLEKSCLQGMEDAGHARKLIAIRQRVGNWDLLSCKQLDMSDTKHIKANYAPATIPQYQFLLWHLQACPWDIDITLLAIRPPPGLILTFSDDDRTLKEVNRYQQGDESALGSHFAGSCSNAPSVM